MIKADIDVASPYEIYSMVRQLALTPGRLAETGEKFAKWLEQNQESLYLTGGGTDMATIKLVRRTTRQLRLLSAALS